MPAQHGIHILEGAGANHVQLAASALLGGSSIESEGAGNLLVGHPFLDRDRGKQRGRAQQVMAAAMAGSAIDQGLPFRDIVLRKTGQGIVLAHDPDHRLALAPGGGERRRDAGHILRQAKSRRTQLRLQQFGALVFFVADFGKLPNFSRDLAKVGRLGVHLLKERALVVGHQGAGREEEQRHRPHIPHIRMRIADLAP